MREDIEAAGIPPDDLAIRQVEENYPMLTAERRFLLNHIPDNSIGAELGVYTGSFSAVLAACPKIKKISFVDPWWTQWGERYPNWSEYTAFGAVRTRAAYELAEARINRAGLSGREIVVGKSEEWLTGQPDQSLDWVYLDSSLIYEHKMTELRLLGQKLGPCGIVMGDDWWVDQIWLAVNDWLREGAEFDVMFAQFQRPCQWMLRRKVPRQFRQDNDMRVDLDLSVRYSDAVRTKFMAGG